LKKNQVIGKLGGVDIAARIMEASARRRARMQSGEPPVSTSLFSGRLCRRSSVADKQHNGELSIAAGTNHHVPAGSC
jgi:hypothetical protein